MKSGMTAKERFHAIMNFDSFDRLPILEWASWWDKTLERWRSEGLPERLDRYDLYRHFGMDVYYQDWIRPRGHSFPKPESHGAGFVKDAVSYESLKQFLYPENAVNADTWKKLAQEQKSGDCVVWFTLEGFFWFPRTLFGIEEHLYAFYDHPELMRRMNEDLAQFHLKTIDEICRYATPDFMTFAEDMSYNNGPMLSKELFDEFITPYYRMIVPKLKERGIRIIVDSDGDVSTPSSWFEEAGIEGILPLERQAGVDVSKLRNDHPNQLYIGAFDKMTMNKGEEAVRMEFERLLPTARQGGFLISCDHQTPPGVSLEQYESYLRIFREYAEKAS